MTRPPPSDRQLDVVLLLGLFALLLFASPLTAWWAAPGNPWYLPYLLWALIIGLAAWTHTRLGR